MLHGRRTEVSLLDELLREARRARSSTLVLSGEAGSGKSALLEYARRQAEDMHVLPAHGLGVETSLPFAALDRLVRPLWGYLPGIPAPQASALRGALGEAGGGGDDRFLIALGTLSLLAEASERHPLLCLVDDAHLLDEASADAMLFVARRLGTEGILMLFATRPEAGTVFGSRGITEHRLGGLDHAAAAALLEEHATIPLAPELRDRIIASTCGNPLALRELPAMLTDAQLKGADPLLTPLPVGARVERAFGVRIRRLPAASKTLLLIAAADDAGELATVLHAGEQLGISDSALDAIEHADLLHLEGQQLTFHHPLVRSAAYHTATVSQRRAAHTAIASVLDAPVDADRLAWHRAAAALTPDPDAVAELDAAAKRARSRSGFAAASHALERAATLTGDERERSARLIAAVENSWLAGRIDRARTLLEGTRSLAASPSVRADERRYRGLLELTGGSPADAGPLLLHAAKEIAPHDRHRALDLLNLASVASVYAGDRAAASAIARVARSLGPVEAGEPRLLVELLIGLGAFSDGDLEAAVRHLRAALALEDDETRLDVEEQPTALLFTGRAALFLGDDEAVLRTHHRAAGRARDAGALGFLNQLLPRLAYAELVAGRWGAAEGFAEEGHHLARELGQPDLVAYSQVLLALLAAYRGDEDECRSLAADVHGSATTHRFALVAEFSSWALSVVELGRADHDAALLRARDITASAAVYWSGLDRIEAAALGADQQTGRAWLDGFEAWAVATDAPWAKAVALHAHALLTADEIEAERGFRAALAMHDEAARPFERARTALAFGGFLRRTRRRVESREHLRAAGHTFEVLGARVWAERARRELRASGESARRAAPGTSERLTPQELQVAQFVSRGLSNHEVAGQLFLSPRTVAFHLRNVFRKLDITSRTELGHLELDAE